MVQGRRRLCFALEAGKSLRIFGYFIGQEFQGDKTVQLYVLSLVDHAHTTAAELLYDAIVRNSLADQRVGGWHGGAHLRARKESSQRSQTNYVSALVKHGMSKTRNADKCPLEAMSFSGSISQSLPANF